MTAARSDLMALADKTLRTLRAYPGSVDAREAVERFIEAALRLAASQPDREAVKEFIASASFASRSSLDSDTIFCEIYTPGYQPAKKGSFGFFVKELRAILSLLSGAGTKSDGGEERPASNPSSRVTHGPSDPSPGPDVSLSAPVGEPVAWQFMASDDVVLSTTADKRVVKQWEQSGYHVRPLYTYPPAPAVGAEDVARAIRAALVENWKDDFGAKWDEDVLLTGCRRVGGGRGYEKPETAAQKLAMDAANAILSLLSGQGERKSKS